MAKSIGLGVRVSPDINEHIEVLADELNVDRSEILRMFITKGLEANPVDDLRRQTFRRRKADGLVGQREPTLRVDSNGKLLAFRNDDEVKRRGWLRPLRVIRAA